MYTVQIPPILPKLISYKTSVWRKLKLKCRNLWNLQQLLQLHGLDGKYCVNYMFLKLFNGMLWVSNTPTLGDTGFLDFEVHIKVLWSLQFLGYLRTLSLKFQKARTKIEVVLALPCWLSQFSWDSRQGRVRTTSILVWAVWAFWNFKLLNRNCSLHTRRCFRMEGALHTDLWKSETSRYIKK